LINLNRGLWTYEIVLSMCPFHQECCSMSTRYDAVKRSELYYHTLFRNATLYIYVLYWITRFFSNIILYTRRQSPTLIKNDSGWTMATNHRASRYRQVSDRYQLLGRHARVWVRDWNLYVFTGSGSGSCS
jgi:hypothetical protein